MSPYLMGKPRFKNLPDQNHYFLLFAIVFL